MREPEYLALFQDAAPDQRVGEASAWYLYSQTAAREIHDVVPEAAIIVMLRNPVDVMHAQHSQLLFNRQEEIEDFGEALAAEEDRADGRRLPRGSHRPENLFYRRMVRFADQVERYLDVFGRDRVHVIVHDDLRTDPRAVYRRTLGFLGVDEAFAPAFEPVNENKGVRNRVLQRLIWDPPLVRRLIPIVRRYPLVHRLRAAILSANSRVEPRRPMAPHLRRQLLEEHRVEIERLGALIGRDLGSWLSDGRANG
jgi:hypothetical protein